MGYNRSRNTPTGQWKDKVGGDTSLYPVEYVSWKDAVEFCRQLSALPEELSAGRTYRLPTEAEWEYACRAGTTATSYWDDVGERRMLKDYAWTAGNSDKHTHPVGQKRPNTWGLCDMLGNVAEWCADWYDPKYYAAAPLRDPAGPSDGTERVSRGGTAESYSVAASSVWRWRSMMSLTGFRVACDVSAVAPPVVEATPAPAGMQEIEARLKEKGLTRRMGYFLLSEEAQFIRYTTTLERLRIACAHAQSECQDVQQQLARVGSAKAAAVKARIQARTYQDYSDTWREYWMAVRAKHSASDAMLLADLSKEGLQKWQKDAQDDFDSAVKFFGGQIKKLQEMFYKLQSQYRELAEDAVVKKSLAEVNAAGKATYRLGPTPSALAAVKKLDHEEELHGQFKKK